MKCSDDLFEVIGWADSNEKLIVTITLNPSHPIYSGHFPGYPVTPGVIQLLIVNEILEIQTKQNVRLVSMPQCKFITVLNPEENPVLAITMEIRQSDNQYDVNAIGTFEEKVFFKFNACYGVMGNNNN